MGKGASKFQMGGGSNSTGGQFPFKGVSNKKKAAALEDYCSDYIRHLNSLGFQVHEGEVWMIFLSDRTFQFKELNSNVKNFSRDPEAYYQRGVAAFDKRRYEEALEDLNTVIEVLNTEAEEVGVLARAYFARAYLCVVMKEIDAALNDCLKALQINQEITLRRQNSYALPRSTLQHSAAESPATAHIRKSPETQSSSLCTISATAEHDVTMSDADDNSMEVESHCSTVLVGTSSSSSTHVASTSSQFLLTVPNLNRNDDGILVAREGLPSPHGSDSACDTFEVASKTKFSTDLKRNALASISAGGSSAASASVCVSPSQEPLRMTASSGVQAGSSACGFSRSIEDTSEEMASAMKLRRAQQIQKYILDEEEARTFTAKLHNLHGEILMRLKKFPQAIEHFNRSIELRAQFVPPYHNRGDCFMAIKDVQRALEDFDRAVEIDATNPNAYCRRALTYNHLANCFTPSMFSSKDSQHQSVGSVSGPSFVDCADGSNGLRSTVLYSAISGTMTDVEIEAQRKRFRETALTEINKAIEICPYYLDYCHKAIILLQCEPKDFKQAKWNIRRAVEMNPCSAEAWNAFGEYFIMRQKYSQAADMYTKAIEIDGSIAIYYSLRGRMYYLLNDFDRSKADHDNAILLDPKDAGCYNERGHVYYSKGESHRAIADYSRAIELNPKNPMFYSNRGGAYQQIKEYSNAINDYSRAIELEPNNPNFRNYRGTTYYEMHSFEEAVKDFTAAIKNNPRVAVYYRNRGDTWSHLNRVQNAIEDYSKAIELDPNNARFYNLRGNLYYDTENYEQAINDFSKAIELSPDTAVYHYNKGDSYKCMNDFNQAVVHFTRAIELNPKNISFYNSRGFAYSELKKYAEAIADYTKAVELAPHEDVRYYRRALVFINDSKWENAEKDLDKAVKLAQTEYGTYYNYRGITHYRRQQWQPAIADFTQAIRCNPDTSLYWLNRGYGYYQMEMYSKAIRDLDMSVDLNPCNCSEHGEVIEKCFSECSYMR